MTKADLVEQVADAIGPGITKKDCALVVDGLLNAIKEALADQNNIEIRGFGTFKVDKYNSRPHTMKWVDKKVYSAAHRTVKFKAGGALRKKLKELYPEGSEKK